MPSNLEFASSRSVFYENEFEDIEKKKKDFTIRARKVISLLERATRNIYRNKKAMKSIEKIDLFAKENPLPKVILRRRRS
jgi:hypothetical protein